MMTRKFRFSALTAIALALFVTSASAGLFDKESEDDKRAALQESRTAALDKFREEKPGAHKLLAESKGYAVFSNIGVNLFLVSTQRGGGILHDNRSGKDLYMKMFSAGGGLGLGVKDFAAIFIFHTDAALDAFRDSGWDFSAQADANLEKDNEGDGMETALTAMPGTSLYQLTDAGLAAQVTLQGSKFWLDEDLN